MSDENTKSKIAEKEEQILQFWQENKIFEKSVEKEAPEGEFVFYDGPPFATGLPHYGHLLGSTAKDLFPRYKTMRGYRVRRRWGWDCHGLPVENIVEKKLGLKHKKDIEALGIQKFNEECRAQVLTYVNEWKKYIDRLGRWVDFDNSYKTMDTTYTESIWWALSQFHKKGMLYEGRKVLLYCPRCETPLSRAEIAMDNSYQDITEEAVTIEFRIKNPEKFGLPDGTYVLAWTTTPWTLPANVALAVGPEIEYVLIEKKDMGTGKPVRFVLAKSRLEAIFGNDKYEITKEIKGKDLVGLEYEPLYDLDAVRKTGKKAWYIVPADFVTTEDGTGIVHTAVIYGEDDYQLGLKVDLPMVPLLLPNGNFNNDAPEFIRGIYVKKAENLIKTDLEKRGLLFDKALNTHSYPHCYRCGTPLIYNALSSWFIDIQKIKKEMLSKNENINWIPEHLKHGRFQDIMEGAPDWTISRNRFWASPLPIWKNEKTGEVKVIGSIEELKKYSEKSGNKYFVMRHGEAENNVKKVLSMKKDNPHHLTEKGIAEVGESAKKLKKEKIDVIISSPFVRTRETAEIVAEAVGLDKKEIQYDERIGEHNYGQWDMMPVEEYYKYYTSFEEAFEKAPPGGENYTDIKKRVGDFLYSLEKKYAGKNILIVTHESPSWLLSCVSSGLDRKACMELSAIDEDFLKNAEFTELQFSPLPHNADYEIDLHRPFIDEVQLIDEDGSRLKRVTEVIDCWVESGSMPFAEWHYPFENKKEFESRFPGDFIAEYIAQTRTWFYYMHAVSVALFGKESFKNVVTTGTILAADGEKMSKSKENYTDPLVIINKYGADALRFYMMTSVVMQAEDLNFKDENVKEIYQRMINILANVVSFYLPYKIDFSGLEETDNVLDKWILSRLKELHAEVTEGLEKYETIRAGRPLRAFIDDLSTWYLRRSRDRFKSENTGQRKTVANVMHYVLLELSKMIAPFMPFLAEDIFQSLKTKSNKESVHLEDWPVFAKATAGEAQIIADMEETRKIVSLALEKRMAAGIKVRQPLQSLKIKNYKIKNSEEYAPLIKDEINVKEVIPDESISEEVELDTKITPELQKEGNVRDFVRAVQGLRKEKNLVPSQTVELLVETDDEGKEFLESVAAEIKKPTNISEIRFESNDGEELKIENWELKIKIK